MKKLSLSSITALLGLCIIPACVLSVTDDVADDEAGTETATTTATDGATDDATTDATTTADEVGTDTTGATDTTETTADTTTDTTTGAVNMCGWDVANMYYNCGFEGADPGGTPIECPMGLVEGAPCADTGLTGAGCCDANGDNWYCQMDETVFFFSCAA